MLSPRREVPLTYVMTSHLDDPDTGERYPVLESSVWLELENDRSEIITVKRGVVCSTDRRLVSVFRGPLLTEPGNSYRQQDYFVLDAGTAQREADTITCWPSTLDGTYRLCAATTEAKPFCIWKLFFLSYMSSKNLVGRQFRPHFQRTSKYATWGDARLSSSLRWKRMKSNSGDSGWSWSLHRIALHGQRSGTTYLQLPLW